MDEAGWSRVDRNGGRIWPRTDPAMIVLVHDGVAGPDGRCLLGNNAGWAGTPGGRRYSCLAGYVEPGESAEAAVLREVREEVGIAVERIGYVGQPGLAVPRLADAGLPGHRGPGGTGAGRPVRDRVRPVVHPPGDRGGAGRADRWTWVTGPG